MKKVVFIGLLFFLINSILFGQSRPFPQNVDYPYGYMAPNVTTSDVEETYSRWKDRFLIECNGMYRVGGDDTSRTISEGIGYGMLLTAYHGEKEYFDGLYAYYNSKRTPEAYNLMGWAGTCNTMIDPGSATDGDIDVAFALIVAFHQWGGDYLDEAKDIIAILKEHYVVQCEGFNVIKPGGQFGGCGLTDISYYTPAFFRILAEVTEDTFWDDVADDSYSILQFSANVTTGLVPDWQSYNGIAGGNPPSGRDNYYHNDASRTPWRMSLDYLWNGNLTAKDWCTKVTNWANGIGASNIVDGYNLNGTARGEYNNSAFVGGFAVGAMCNHIFIVNDFASRLLYLDGSGYDDQYFNLCLRNLYMLVLTGNFWKPTFITAISEIEKVKDITLYPNPVLNGNEIAISGISKLISVEIINLSGQVIIPEYRINSDNIIVAVSNLMNGFYYIRIQEEERTICLKFIK